MGTAMNLEHARRLFLTANLLAIPVLVGLWLMAPPRSYESWGYPLLGAHLLWVVAALAWTRIPVARLLSASHMISTGFWLGLLTCRLFTGAESTPLAERATPDLYLVFALLGIVAHLVFATRTALQASIGILLATVAVSGSWFVWALLQGYPLASVASVWTYEAILGISMLMLHALVRSKDEHAYALLETARMRDIAYTDALTSLPNRRELEERLEHAVATAYALERSASVVFFDLDDFKSVNDAHGHAVGDTILAQVGDAVHDLLRSDDTFGRWGGEEYLIVAPGTNHDQATALADRVRTGLEAHEFAHGLRVTASFGVATSTGNTDARALLSKADERLYQAKREGRNRVAGRHGAARDRSRPKRATACED